MIYLLSFLLIVSLSLHWFIQHRYRALKRYADKVDRERVAMALEIRDLRDAQNALNYTLHGRS